MYTNTFCVIKRGYRHRGCGPKESYDPLIWPLTKCLQAQGFTQQLSDAPQATRHGNHHVPQGSAAAFVTLPVHPASPTRDPVHKRGAPQKELQLCTEVALQLAMEVPLKGQQLPAARVLPCTARKISCHARYLQVPWQILCSWAMAPVPRMIPDQLPHTLGHLKEDSKQPWYFSHLIISGSGFATQQAQDHYSRVMRDWPEQIF